MPRWPSRDKRMEAVARLIVTTMQEEDRAPFLEEVMAATGARTKRTATGLLRQAGMDPNRRGRPWPSHAEYMPQVLELVLRCAKSGRRISAAEVQEKVGVGPDLAAALLADIGLAADQHPEDDELLPQAKAIIDELGDRWSINQLVKRLHVHPRRAKRLAEDLGVLPAEIPRGHSAAGSTWWTEEANRARWAKREETGKP